MASGIPVLDDFLEGGLPIGAVTEWGAPLGHGGRDLLLAWLARATQGFSGAAPLIRQGLGGQGREDLPATNRLGATTASSPAWALWVYARAQLTVYPPAWLARGVSLARMRFACSAKPLADLRPVFLEPLFKVIVLDAPRGFTDEDCAFVARQARLNDQVVVLVRDAFLQSERGNVWTKLRVNCWQEAATAAVWEGQTRVRIVRGLSPRQLAIGSHEIERAYGEGREW